MSGKFEATMIGKTTAKVCEAYTRLKREVSKIWLNTKYLLARGSAQLRSSILVDGDNIKLVMEFYYFGTVGTSDNDISSVIRRRIV